LFKIAKKNLTPTKENKKVHNLLVIGNTFNVMFEAKKKEVRFAVILPLNNFM
jgi:hypothetical protein